MRLNWKKAITRGNPANITFWMALPAVVALFCGVYLGMEIRKIDGSRVEHAELTEVESLQKTLLDAFWNDIDHLRSRALALSEIREPERAALVWGGTEKNSPILLHWAEFETRDHRVNAVHRAVRNPAWKPAFPLQGFEEIYLKQASEQLGMRELLENGVAVIRVKPDPQQASELLALAFGIPGSGGTKAVLALVDPNQAFASISRLGDRARSGRVRAYLVSHDGYVLAHSQKNYGGTNFASVQGFSEAFSALRQTLEGTRVSGTGTFRGVDQLPVRMAYARAGSLPIAVSVEKTVQRRPRSQGTWQRVAGTAVGVTVVLAMLLSGTAWLLARVFRAREEELVAETHAEHELQNEAALESVDSVTEVAVAQAMEAKPAQAAPMPPAFEPDPESAVIMPVTDREEAVAAALAAFSAGHEQIETQARELRQEVTILRRQLEQAREEERLLAEFEKEALAVRDARKVAQRMAQTAGKICQSPVLFFGYREGLRTAVLEAVEGAKNAERLQGLSFTLPQSSVDQVLQKAAKGEAASFADDSALAKLLLDRAGVAHFDAWAVTGYGALGRLAGRPRLLGVLVLLQPGVDSVTRQESLGRMIRATGLVYENTLLAQ